MIVILAHIMDIPFIDICWLVSSVSDEFHQVECVRDGLGGSINFGSVQGGYSGAVVRLHVVDVIVGVVLSVSARQLLPSLVVGMANVGAASGTVALAEEFAGLGKMMVVNNVAVPTKLKMAVLHPILLLVGAMLFVSLDCDTLDVTIKPLNI